MFQSCKIPRLEKDRPEVMKFIKKYEALQCGKKHGPDWLEIDEQRRMQLTVFAKT
jgi:hypothetical protein